MPLQRILENYLTVSYVGQSGQIGTTKYRDNLFNRVWALKNDGVKDVAIQSGEYIKKDFAVIHAF
jgi:hypothetical protein